MKIHHIGYMVKDIRKAIEIFKEMGYELEKRIVCDEYRGIDVGFLAKDGYKIELVASHSKDSVISNLQKKMGNSPYHICYEVDDLYEATRVFLERNYVILQEPHGAIALEGRRVVFLFGSQIGIIELLESSIKEKR